MSEGRDRKYVSASRAVHAVFAMFCIHRLNGVGDDPGFTNWFRRIDKDPAKCRMHDGHSCRLHDHFKLIFF
ncbi:hypothetical protein C0J26_22980 [Pseudomonas baetica]|nr:hypothetical protein C0J26_22980 [Pseudomonas baetica]